MINKIIGIFWILIGFVGLLYPGFIQGFFRKKARKKRFKTLIFLLLFAGSFGLSLFFKAQGIWLKVLTTAGIIMAVKLFLFVNQKAGAKFDDLIGNMPKAYLRFFAALLVVLGITFWKFL
ncbi:MAG: hypothetical protein KAJ66_00870 [Candidatus Omnitrophica bacterium]|nr:hypothetical protein [Candidatus Omnitrophota bacterium]